jgi:hypothetical protein
MTVRTRNHAKPCIAWMTSWTRNPAFSAGDLCDTPATLKNPGKSWPFGPFTKVTKMSWNKFAHGLVSSCLVLSCLALSGLVFSYRSALCFWFLLSDVVSCVASCVVLCRVVLCRIVSCVGLCCVVSPRLVLDCVCHDQPLKRMTKNGNNETCHSRSQSRSGCDGFRNMGRCWKHRGALVGLG